jgi:hypothetical protein
MPQPDPKVLEKIRRLLALAGDPGASEEEARTASVAAARLMREHGLSVAPAARSAPPESSPIAPAAAPRWTVDELRAHLERAGELATVAQTVVHGPGGLIATFTALRALLVVEPPPAARGRRKRAKKK